MKVFLQILLMIAILIFVLICFGLNDIEQNKNKNKAVEEAYKQGQIDYHNGIIKYSLTEQADGTRIWMKKD